jgi:hypothetical protein
MMEMRFTRSLLNVWPVTRRRRGGATWFAAMWIIWFATSVAGVAQVHSLTLGINVNSPYGLREPWVMIREGLLRQDFVESISVQPDTAAGTGELRTRHGRLPDLDLLAQALRDTGAGASLRGVEASVAGELAKERDQFYLRLTGDNPRVTFRLQPLSALVQRGRQPTESEKMAYRTLTAGWTDRPMRVVVTGPVLKRADSHSHSHQAPTLPAGLALEVRRFILTP